MKIPSCTAYIQSLLFSIASCFIVHDLTRSKHVIRWPDLTVFVTIKWKRNLKLIVGFCFNSIKTVSNRLMDIVYVH